MPKSTTLSNANVQAQGDAMVALLSNGYLRIYSGAQPATADTVPGAQVLLAELRFNTPASGATPATGIITFTTTLMAAGVAALATGTAGWYRCLKADGATAVVDGDADIAANSPNLVLSTTAIVAGATVSVTSFNHTINKTSVGY